MEFITKSVEIEAEEIIEVVPHTDTKQGCAADNHACIVKTSNSTYNVTSGQPIVVGDFVNVTNCDDIYPIPRRFFEGPDAKYEKKDASEPKEKTYSQADMDKMQQANQSLGEEVGRLSLKEIIMKKEYNLLLNSEKVTIKLKDAQKKISGLERENDMLKMHNKNLYDSQKELCDRFVCGCETVVWVEKGTVEIITCPACESPVGKES